MSRAILKKSEVTWRMILINKTCPTWGQRKQIVNTDTSSAFKVNMANLLANSSLFTHPTVMEQHYHSCRGFLAIIHSLLALFWSPPTPKGNDSLLHIVYQLVANCVCQWVLRALLLKTAACCGLKTALSHSHFIHCDDKNSYCSSFNYCKISIFL